MLIEDVFASESSENEILLILNITKDLFTFYTDSAGMRNLLLNIMFKIILAL